MGFHVVGTIHQTRIALGGLMTWTELDKATIKGMWEAGDSASLIADRLRTTRNAIIGLVFRNKWVSPNQHGIRPAKPAGKVKRVVPYNVMKRVSRASSPTPQPPMEADPEPSIDDLAIPIEQRKSVMQLTDHTCRFPIGSPGEGGDLFFCGAEPLVGKPYCGPHFRRTRAPPTDRQPHSFQLVKTSSRL